MSGSITSWNRLEPRVRDAEMASGPSARLFDPLWLLARQWQTGEFQAEDAGTPIMARTRATCAPLIRRALGAVPANTRIEAPAFDPLRMPLEVEVERRPDSSTRGEPPPLPLLIAQGQHFLHMLEAEPLSRSYRAAFIARFRFEDAAAWAGQAAALVRLAPRALDPRRLAAAVRRSATTLVEDPALALAPGDRSEVREAAVRWLAWREEFTAEPDPGDDEQAWQPARVEYAVSLATRLSADPFDEVTLTAAEYADGRLEWSDFDLDGEVNMGTAGEQPFAPRVETAIPAPVTLSGVPAPRFWSFEDGVVAATHTSAGPGDLAQLLLAEYAGSYGNDWFVVPLTLPVGSVTRIESLVVTDTFGVRTLLKPVGDRSLPGRGWGMWQLDFIRRPGGESADAAGANRFFIPPTCGVVLESRPVEEVHLVRDEMANLAWAIERTIEGPLGAAFERPRGPLADNAPAIPAAGGSAGTRPPDYRLASPVPLNWVPLLPAQTRDNGRLVTTLRRARFLSIGDEPQLTEAKSRVLNEQERLSIFDEEVPREGAIVTRTRRLTRWVDGTTWLWSAYRKQTGRGEASSALAYDRLVDPPPP